MARDFLAANPTVVRRYDALEGSGFYSYWDAAKATFRQVYFEEERSLADKYDYALVTGLGGIGIWTLDNDRNYTELADVLRSRFYSPVRSATVLASTRDLKRVSGAVYVTVRGRVTNTGTVPLSGVMSYTIRDGRDRLVARGSWPKETVYPGRAIRHARTIRLGLAANLRAGTYVLRLRFDAGGARYRTEPHTFRQPY
jgi:hypothetical protein